MNDFNKMIIKIGEELGIKVTLLSDGWTKVLEKENLTHFITGYQFDNNYHGVGNIMDDKGLFWDILKYKKIPVIEQYIIYKDYDKELVIDYFNKHNREIIVKANISNAGKEVFKVNNEKELFKIIDKLFLSQYTISLCPYYHIKNEYRVIILNNKIKNIFGKEKPYIIGDGIKTIKELAYEYNDYYQQHQIDNENYIPKVNEKIELDFKFNLSSGAKSFTNIDGSLKSKIEKLALIVARELNISFASIDIVDIDNKLLVMEANSGVTMNKFIKQNDSYDIAYNIYKEAIIDLFKNVL